MLLTATAVAPLRAEEAPQPVAEENDLKAAFIYNFAKFTHWPAANASATDQPITICVFGRIDFQRQLASVDGKSVGEQPVVVKYLRDILEVPVCRILFIGQLDPQELKAVLGSTQQFPVLTISDAPGFAQSGGIVEIFREDQRLRLRVNTKSAESAGVKLSSKVLRLAIIVQ